MLENDLLLSTFAAKYLDKFTEQQVEQYDRYEDQNYKPTHLFCIIVIINIHF